MYIIQAVVIFLALSKPLQTEVTTVYDYFTDIVKNATKSIKVNPDSGLNIFEYLWKYGYPIESHNVTTEDGYILGVHRIPHGRNESSSGKVKPVVLLMHGLLSSSIEYVSMGPGKAIGLMLADAGYDVWLGNNRGNTWSRNHKTLNPDTNASFWDYSFDECGYYDLPAKIDYILEITGQKKIFYIGHSQGTTQFFAMASLRPEYNDKIELMTALAPVAYMKHLSSPLVKFLVLNQNILQVIAKIFHFTELFRHSDLRSSIGIYVCSDGSPFQELCAQGHFLLGGFDYQQLDKSILSVMASNYPAGISAKMVIHLGQEIKSGYFRRYDYGLENLNKYKTLTPPHYNLSAISAPIALFYGQNDFMAAVTDVEQLARELPNVQKQQKMERKMFNHVSFIWAKDVDKLLNNDLIDYMNSFVNYDTITTTAEPNSGVILTSSFSPAIIIFMLIKWM